MKHSSNHSVLPARMRLSSGLSLVELLVVIVIIIILAALTTVGVRKTKQSARAATCMTNVKQVGMALLMHAADNNNKLIALVGVENPQTGRRPPVWTWQLARGGYLGGWSGEGDAPCGTGVWTCPECEFVSPNYGGYGVVEGAIFAYEELSPTGVSEKGSLRLSRIAEPANTWLVGDTHIHARSPQKGWYAIWPQPARWNDHGPAVARHGGKANVCMMDGHAERMTLREMEERRITVDILDRSGGRGR